MPREPEVADPGVLALGRACDEDVRRLHVPMDEAGCVGSVEAFGCLSHEVESTFRRESVLCTKDLTEIRALDVRHRKIEKPVLLTRCQRRNDVWVVEPRCQARFLEEPLPEALVSRQLGSENLQGDA